LVVFFGGHAHDLKRSLVGGFWLFYIFLHVRISNMHEPVKRLKIQNESLPRNQMGNQFNVDRVEDGSSSHLVVSLSNHNLFHLVFLSA
jgi:hypothetical protein